MPVVDIYKHIFPYILKGAMHSSREECIPPGRDAFLPGVYIYITKYMCILPRGIHSSRQRIHSSRSCPHCLQTTPGLAGGGPPAPRTVNSWPRGKTCCASNPSVYYTPGLAGGRRRRHGHGDRRKDDTGVLMNGQHQEGTVAISPRALDSSLAFAFDVC